MEEIVTCDLSKFGYREIDLAIELLKAYKEDLNTIKGEKISLCFNTNSGCVFLSDDDYNSYMINDETNKLEEWFNCPICGFEGFKKEVTDKDNHFDSEENKIDEECKEWIKGLE